MRSARSPLARFLALGILLYAAGNWGIPERRGEETSRRGEIVITAAQVARLRDDYTRETGLPLTPDAVAALVRRAIDEEILYREALARGLERDDRSIEWQLAERMHFLQGSDDDAMGEQRTHLARAAFAIGLDQGDAIIRRMLIEKMRLLAVHNATRITPSDAEIRTYFEQHADQFHQAERLSFWHVFLARERRGDRLARDTQALLEGLQREDSPPASFAVRGDGFAVDAHVVGRSAAEVSRTFGTAFAAALAQSPLQEWTGPIASPYGLHLVWLEERTPAQLPPIELVRSQIVRRLRAERREAIVRDFIAELERVYAVRVEPGPGT